MLGQHLQDYYPERLKIALVVHSNWLVKIVVSMIKVFLSKSTKEKIAIVKNNKHLLDYIPEKNLPEIYRD